MQSFVNTCVIGLNWHARLFAQACSFATLGGQTEPCQLDKKSSHKSCNSDNPVNQSRRALNSLWEFTGEQAGLRDARLESKCRTCPDRNEQITIASKPNRNAVGVYFLHHVGVNNISKIPCINETRTIVLVPQWLIREGSKKPGLGNIVNNI